VTIAGREVEQAFATETSLDATLLDILVYQPGGKFLRHKDTPRDARQLGTLLVEVPLAHRGGELVLVESDEEHRVGWGSPAAGPRWVAFYGDVDHTVEQVETGTRVTLAYTRTATDRPRTDPELAAHLDVIADAAIALLSEPAARPTTGTLIVPCERLVVASDERTEPLARTMLRGHDAAIARTFERCGIEVRVIELLIPSEADVGGPEFPLPADIVYRLRRPIPASVLATCEALSFEDDVDTEEYGPMSTASIESYVEPTELDACHWLVRRAAGAKLVYEGIYSQTGYFGNEAGDGLLYVAAALELHLPA
jgi:hypothetical protein